MSVDRAVAAWAQARQARTVVPPRLTWLFVLMAFAPVTVLAQTTPSDGPPQPAPQVSPSPSPPAGASEAAVPAPAAQDAPAGAPGGGEPAGCNPLAGDVCLTAPRQENLGGGHFHASGFVDLRFGDARLQSDELDMFVTTKPDGTSTRTIEAKGSVVFLRGEERISGERLVMDLDRGAGVFENATGYVQPGVFVEARKIERVDADTYRISGGRFTSCSQPNPRWRFGASSATVEVDDKVKATHVVFRVKDIPVFYFPYFTYPIRQDQRASGFLMPHYGSDPVRGRNIGGGFFWAMGRSSDQTLMVDNYSKWGWGFGHELRYKRKSPSGGSFRSYFFRRESEEGVVTWNHDLFWNATQILPGSVRASVFVQESSTQEFRRRFLDDPDLALSRVRRTSANLQRSFKLGTVQLLGEEAVTFFFGKERVNRRLPSFSINGAQRKEKHTGLVFGLQGRAERLAFGEDEAQNDYSRFDVAPSLARPMSVPFLQVTPRVTARYTRYGLSDLDPDFVAADLTGPPVTRQYADARLEITGPSFSRVFITPGNFYSERFKHVISPQVVWTYRSKIDNFDAIPRFDGDDLLPATNQVSYGLVQRFYSKRPGRTGKPEPWEFLMLSVTQTYYVQTAASAFDPSFLSAAWGPGGDPVHSSPIQSRLRLRPSTRFDANMHLEYDVNYKEVRNLGLSTNANYDRLSLGLGWSRFKQPGVQTATFDTLRASARLALVPGRLTLSGDEQYDLVTKKLRWASARLRYEVQCCGFVADMTRRDFFGDKPVTSYNFSIELANIGSLGNFLGTQPGTPGPFGYR